MKAVALSLTFIAALHQPASAQQTSVTPTARCIGALADRGLATPTPALNSSSVRARACNCIAESHAASASNQLSVDADAIASQRLNDMARSCISKAIAEEPIPPLPARTMAALADAYERPGEPPRFIHAKVDFSTCERPEYPKSAAQRDATGSTRLAFRVAQSGKATDGFVVGSAGADPAHKVLDVTALFSLMQCQFKPATLNGSAVESWVDVTYIWRLQ